MTNDDKDIFIPLVPSVLGAMLMSKVSRQKEGFREDLIKMVEEDMINLPKENQLEHFKNSVVVANGFMEKWGVNYGHSSIKELDTLQMCIENKSRWFSEIIETVMPSKYISYIEYSLRYNPPKSYYIPSEFYDNELLLEEYKEFCDECFRLYEKINFDFYSIIDKKYSDLSEREKKLKAFENARNVLPLSTISNMGLQSNLRAFCDMLCELFSYEGINNEIFETAKLMKSEAEIVSVGMVKHTKPTDYLKSYVKSKYEREFINDEYKIYKEPKVIVDNEIVGDLSKISNFGNLELMNRFDRLPNIFRNIGKYVTIYMSESAHHQFIRHRSFDFITKFPDVKYGILLPSEILNLDGSNQDIINIANGIEKDILEIYKKSCDLYEKIVKYGYIHLAPYVVLNCNIRKIEFFGNLSAMNNFVTLRKEIHAQDEIRKVANDLDDNFKDFEKKILGYKNDKNMI